MENLDKLVLELCKLPQETGWVEFKHNNCDPKMVGEDISALANSAVIADRSYAYMIWGVDDNTHEIIGTKVNLKKEKKGNQELENWLRYLLSKAVGNPVTFEKIDYIRVGSYTKKAIEFPALQAQLWDRLRNQQFEDAYAIADIQLQDIPRYLNCEAYFDILNMPVPTSIDRYAHYLVEDGIIAKQDNGLYAITNLGAILFAKRLSEFPRVGRKAIRIVQYDGLNRLVILKEETTTEGYAISFENAVKYVNTLLPSKEDIDSVRRKSISTYPIPAIREAIANSLIHQDFFITGTLIEVFENRVEVTNSGTPLVDIMRIVDNPPKSRNEKLASLMRRLNMCEELGRGWDRMVISCELQKLPAPRIQIYQESTKVSLFSHLDFTNIPMEDKIWATYLHACIKYIEGDALTNSSLRERFGVAESSSGSISRLIKEVLKNKLIKPIDPNTAPRYMKYIPIWG